MFRMVEAKKKVVPPSFFNEKKKSLLLATTKYDLCSFSNDVWGPQKEMFYVYLCTVNWEKIKPSANICTVFK